MLLLTHLSVKGKTSNDTFGKKKNTELKIKVNDDIYIYIAAPSHTIHSTFSISFSHITHQIQRRMVFANIRMGAP